MAECAPSTIQRNQLRDCDVELTEGVSAMYYVGQLRDLESFAVDPTNPLIITDIVMKTGAKLKVFEGFGKSTAPSVGHEVNEFGMRLPQTYVLAIASNTPETKLDVESLLNATDVFFIYKREGQGEHEEMGIVNGMKVLSGGFSYTPNDDANKGSYIITFSNTSAKRMPRTIRHLKDGKNDTASYLAGKALAVV